MRRSTKQIIIDTILFPLRSISIFDEDRWGLSSMRTDRYEYTSRELRGYTLDVGCGPQNWFIKNFAQGNGVGIDVFKYAGLTDENIVEDITHFPFPDAHFDSVTFIANINHVPESKRDIELGEAYRVLKPGGNILITMAYPLALIAMHIVVAWYDKLFHTSYDVDAVRGMHEEEAYFIRDKEIVERLTKAGFTGLRKRRFTTQWGLNWVWIGWKQKTAPSP